VLETSSAEVIRAVEEISKCSPSLPPVCALYIIFSTMS